MFSITSAAVYGVHAIPISIETDVASGLPQFTIVGLPDVSVRESRDRIRSAFRNCGFTFPRGRITVNLAPAHLRKQGAVFDLAIALSLLERSGVISLTNTHPLVVLGELGLSGEVRPVQGVLPVALMMQQQRYPMLIVPKHNSQEAARLSTIQVIGVTHLRELIDHLTGKQLVTPTTKEAPTPQASSNYCFSHIRGHTLAKRGLEIGAAGNHHVLLQGPPGTGKTLLAQTYPSILPPLTEQEAIEVASIYSVSTQKSSTRTHFFERPFRAPHHSCSAISLIGGGAWPQPGEVSLAHHGVLFLDEIPEFGRHVLETLRQPLEIGTVSIARASGAVDFPARFQLLATRNPCPCGFATDPFHACECSEGARRVYEQKLSGPLMDRIDLVIDVPNIHGDELIHSAPSTESSSTIRERIKQALPVQPFTKQKQASLLTIPAEQLLKHAFDQHLISTRGFFRLQRVAYTIARLAQSETIEEEHVAEAMLYRLRTKQ